MTPNSPFRATIIVALMSAAFAATASPLENGDTTSSGTQPTPEQIGAALEKAVQCDTGDWSSLRERISGLKPVKSGTFDTETGLPSGIKIFGHDAWKIRELETGAEFFWVYLNLKADTHEMGKLAGKLHMRVRRDDSMAIEPENLPFTRYYRTTSKGRRLKNGDFTGEDKSVELDTILSNGQRLVAVGCREYSGDPG